MKFKTMSVHSGQRIDPQTGALTTPLYQSSTFSYFNAQAGKERFAGQAPGFIYSRFGNPTTAELEQKLAALEGADEALVVASGMAAVSAIMYALADSGDEVAYIGPLYGGTDAFLKQTFSRAGIKVTAYESDRDYEQAKQQFAQSFAETQRQFDLQYGLDTRTADREDKRLALDDRLGTGRLALDTELGRGALANDTTRANNDTARVGIERDRLGLDTELGRGRLALDTRLGEGGLRLNAADLAFRQRSDDRSQAREDNKFRAEVLRNPSDYVFRAFQSRGAQAPTDRITQADILNTIGTHAAGGTANEPYFLAGGGGPELIANHGDGTFSVASAPQTQRILSRSPEGVAALNSEVMGGAQQWNGQTPGGWQRLHQYMNDPRWAEWAATMGRGPWRMGAEGAMPESRPSVMPAEGSRMGPLTMQPVPAAQPATAQPVVNWMGNRPMEAAPTPRMGLTGYSSGTDDAFFQELDRLSSYTPAAAPTYTQDQIVNAARTYSPPAVSAALAGQDEGTYRPATSGLTLRRFGRLTPGEQAALSTRLGVEFNTSLQDELSGLQSRFGNVRSTPMARMAA